MDSLIRAIETDRAEYLLYEIRPKQKLSIHEYSVDAAINDARAFHERGSFYHGLALIRQDIEKANAKRAESVEKTSKDKTR